jgi:hypothetical protein
MSGKGQSGGMWCFQLWGIEISFPLPFDTTNPKEKWREE